MRIIISPWFSLNPKLIESSGKVELRKKTLVNIEKAQEKQKMYYDEKHCKDKEMFKVISEHD